MQASRGDSRRPGQLEENLEATGWAPSAGQVGRRSEAGDIEDAYPYRVIRELQWI